MNNNEVREFYFMMLLVTLNAPFTDAGDSAATYITNPFSVRLPIQDDPEAIAQPISSASDVFPELEAPKITLLSPVVNNPSKISSGGLNVSGKSSAKVILSG